MTFAENLNRICKSRGITLTAFIKSLGMSTSKVTAINNGSLPKESEMILFAKKLNCSLMDFFVDEDNFETIEQPMNEDEEDILRVYRSLSRRAKHEFMSMVYEFENREILEGDKDNTAAV